MTLSELSGFVASNGLLLLLPLAIIEGPIVAVLAGVLCAQGVLDWRFVLAILVAGDLIGDLIYYAAGRFSQGWLHRMVLRLRLPLQGAKDLAARVSAHSTRMLLIGKWTHAIGALVLIAAGVARVGIARFMVINLLATLPKSALLLGAGMWAGANAAGIFHDAGYIAPALLVLGAAAVFVLLRRAAVDPAA